MIGLIIFGTRGVTYSADKGEFDCPVCNGRSAYNHKRVRRFFTLYFIPVIPLDMLGEYVECGGCAGTFKPEILELAAAPDGQPQGSFEAEFHHAMKRVMVLMMLADGVIEMSEIQSIQDIYQRLAGKDLTEADIRTEAVIAQEEGLSVHDYLGRLLGSLNDSGKEMVVKAAYMVAASDGDIPEEEMQLLRDVGKALEMTDAHFNGVLQTMV